MLDVGLLTIGVVLLPVDRCAVGAEVTAAGLEAIAAELPPTGKGIVLTEPLLLGAAVLFPLTISVAGAFAPGRFAIAGPFQPSGKST